MNLVMLALGGLALYTLYGVWFWYNEGKKMQKSGYLPPSQTFFARITYKLLTKLATFLYVGPIKVVGRKNAQFKGRLMLVGNHQFELDFATTAQSLPYCFRHLAKAEEVKGLKGMAAAWTGHFAVHVEGGKAQGSGSNAVIETMGNVLVSEYNARELVYPQGKLVYDNILRAEDFRTGAVRAMQHAATKIDRQPLAALPIGIVYKKDPAQASWFQKLVHGVGLKGFRKWGRNTRYGATVVIGEPIPFASLPADPKAATEVLRLKIQELVDQAAKG